MRNHMFSQGSNAKCKFLFISILTAFFSLVFSNTAKADDAAYVEFNSETQKLTFKYGEKPGANDETHFYYDLNEGKNEPGWLVHNNDILEAEFESGFENARPTSCYKWFSGCSSMTKVAGITAGVNVTIDEGEVIKTPYGYLNTENVTDMESMFSYCSSLFCLDLRNFTFQNCFYAKFMFYECSSLTAILVDEDSWNIDQVIINFFTLGISDNPTANLFYGCRKLIGNAGNNYKYIKTKVDSSENFQAPFANFICRDSEHWGEENENCFLTKGNYKIFIKTTIEGAVDINGDPVAQVILTSDDENELRIHLEIDDSKNYVFLGWADDYYEDFRYCDFRGNTSDLVFPSNFEGNRLYYAILQYKDNVAIEVNDNATFTDILQQPIVYQLTDISLGVDLDAANDEYLLLGVDVEPFYGTVNGNGHAIRHLKRDVSIKKVQTVGTDKVAMGSGLLGVLGNGAKIENLNIEDATVAAFFTNNENLNSLDELTLPLLADVNGGLIKHCSLSTMIAVNDYNLKDGAKVNLALVGNNDNDEADEANQASTEHVAVYLPNINLLYETYNDAEYNFDHALRYYYSDNFIFSFDIVYCFWCRLANYLGEYYPTVQRPTFESFVAWYKGTEGDNRTNSNTIIKNCDFDTDADESGLTALVTALTEWYAADAQASLRATDATTWNNYLNPQNNDNGNEVAVVATQNLCKSPGKGRVHKVCSAPKGSGNKDGQLSPFDEEYMEFTSAEFASGIAAHWLNYDGRGFTGNYNKMWSQGLLHPIVASSKNGYTVKLNVTTDNDAKSVTVPEYAKVGSKVKMLFTDPLKGVTFGGQPLATENGADYATFTVPGSRDGEGIVDISVSFEPTPTMVNTATTSAVRIYAHGNTITIRDADCKSVTISDLRGTTIAFAQTVDGAADITVADRGVYVVKCGTTIQKVSIW